MTKNGFQRRFHNCTAQDAAVLLCSVSSACDLLLQYLKADRFRECISHIFSFCKKTCHIFVGTGCLVVSSQY